MAAAGWPNPGDDVYGEHYDAGAPVGIYDSTPEPSPPPPPGYDSGASAMSYSTGQSSLQSPPDWGGNTPARWERIKNRQVTDLLRDMSGDERTRFDHPPKVEPLVGANETEAAIDFIKRHNPEYVLCFGFAETGPDTLVPLTWVGYRDDANRGAIVFGDKGKEGVLYGYRMTLEEYEKLDRDYPHWAWATPDEYPPWGSFMEGPRGPPPPPAGPAFGPPSDAAIMSMAKIIASLE